MVRIVWTEASIRDLKEIFEYISVDSSHYATLTVNKIYQRAQVLANNPSIGRVVPEINNKSIRELISGNYRTIYRIKSGTEVDILRVFHSSRFLSRNFIK
ncbi:MAG TPA: type II toxin-antitoxin system RelE/ParE family toxin [Bacteroidales bacterium]